MNEQKPFSSGHFILRRFRLARPTGTAHGAECLCGDTITAASRATCNDLVLAHLGGEVAQ